MHLRGFSIFDDKFQGKTMLPRRIDSIAERNARQNGRDVRCSPHSLAKMSVISGCIRLMLFLWLAFQAVEGCWSHPSIWHLSPVNRAWESSVGRQSGVGHVDHEHWMQEVRGRTRLRAANSAAPGR